jgi:hypothetical protein
MTKLLGSSEDLLHERLVKVIAMSPLIKDTMLSGVDVIKMWVVTVVPLLTVEVSRGETKIEPGF